MERWRSYRSYLEERFHAPVYRIGIDGGFSCPNRDKDGRGGCSFCDGTGAVAVYHRQSESGFHHDSAYDGSTASRLLPRLDSIESQIERGREFLIRRYGAEMFSIYFQQSIQEFWVFEFNDRTVICPTIFPFILIDLSE